MPKISIIIPVFNAEKYIRKCLDSISSQTFSDFEVICVDDGSKDNSLDVIKNFVQRDHRIKLYTHENCVNKGLRETLKLGIANAKGQYIAFLESDDYWHPDNLAVKVSILDKNPQVGIVDDAVKLVGNERLFGRYDEYWNLRQQKFNNKIFPADIFHDLFVENLIPTFSCAVCRADILKKCNFEYFYTPHLDRSLWLQICKKEYYYHVPDFLTYWRIHGDSYISSEDKSYRKSFIKKVYALLMPCYAGGLVNPLLHWAVIRFIFTNLWRSIKQRTGKK